MKIFVAGGTGFIGSAVVAELKAAGHTVTILTRQSRPDTGGVGFLSWTPGKPGPWQAALAGADAVVNLAGESIAQRWTDPAKARILDTRIAATRALVEAIAAAKHKPAVLVSASAIGYYGPTTTTVNEEAPAGGDFLAGVCRTWEHEARMAEASGVRVVRLRIGVVLGKGGGALSKMLLPFKLGLGGPLGDGTQVMSWVHLDDVAALVRTALQNAELSGPVNATAPAPVSNAEFSKELGRALHRPAILPAPAFAVRTLLGEMSDILLKGQSVLPVKAQAAGFKFKYPTLPEALSNLLS